MDFEIPHPENCPLFRISLEVFWIWRVDLYHGRRLVKLIIFKVQHTSYIAGEGDQVSNTKTYWESYMLNTREPLAITNMRHPGAHYVIGVVGHSPEYGVVACIQHRDHPIDLATYSSKISSCAYDVLQMTRIGLSYFIYNPGDKQQRIRLVEPPSPGVEPILNKIQEFKDELVAAPVPCSYLWSLSGRPHYLGHQCATPKLCCPWNKSQTGLRHVKMQHGGPV